MTRLLPPRPSHRFVQEQAKDLLKAHSAGDTAVCPTLRLLRRFQAADDAAILAAPLALHEAQFALALDYGLPSWPALKAHIEATRDTRPTAAPRGRFEGPADDPQTRLVLAGVPKVGFHRRLCPFPGCVEAVLEYLGRPRAYSFLMAASGASFRHIWNRDDGGNVDLMYLHPEPHRLLFAALGCRYRAIGRDDRDALLTAAKSSIAAGIPVIAFGILGPPEAGLVAGYDRGGEVLLGHSYFDFTRRGGGAYYEKDGWHADMDAGPLGMIVLEGRDDPPSPRATLRATLQWALDLADAAHRPALPEHVCGLAAMDAWAGALEIDADYPTNTQQRGPDGDPLIRTRAMVHGDQAVMQAERAFAAEYLRDVADAAPEAAGTLRDAAAHYERAVGA